MTPAEFVTYVRDQVTNLIKTIKVSGKINIVQLMQTIFQFIETISTFVASVEVDGKLKKEVVLEAAGRAFDYLWAFVPFFSVFKPLLTPIIRGVVLQIIDAAIEYVYHNKVKPALEASNQPMQIVVDPSASQAFTKKTL